MSPWLVLLLLLALQTKHLLADYLWQTNAMVQTKGIYGNLTGATHSLLHAALTGAILIVLTGSALGLIGILVLVEFVVHYHTDWAKENLASRLDQSPKQKGYWILIGLDQFFHQLTYVLIVAAVIAFG